MTRPALEVCPRRVRFCFSIFLRHDINPAPCCFKTIRVVPTRSKEARNLFQVLQNKTVGRQIRPFRRTSSLEFVRAWTTDLSRDIKGYRVYPAGIGLGNKTRRLARIESDVVGQASVLHAWGNRVENGPRELRCMSC
jgi:hypothetical protein